jgi:class 3 adenylate cyclase/tetratricopeptide (TPR) repeat protein
MQCPKCQFENREGVKFCEECGANFDLICPNCSAKIPLGRKFCGECGFKLTEPSQAPAINYSEPQSYTPKFLADKILTSRISLKGERKLVTVLFADVANYTSMAEKLDPEEVHQIMDGCFKILMADIHRYEGTINQFTGDGVMALFGAPIAHEDHAQRACYAALSIQKTMGEYGDKLNKDHGIDFKMRIGLNSGHVVIGAIGDDLRMDYTAIGDTTNLASRIESMAKPGQSMTSRNTYNLARDFFEFSPLGKVQVKGKDELQELYELIKASEVETRIEAAAARGLSKFVGRERETEDLKGAFEKISLGSGQVIGVVGEAGVGKSRLLIEFRNMLPKDEYTCLEGRCLHYSGSMAYLPILDILRSYFDIKEGDRESDIKNKIEEKILQLDDRLKTVFSPFHELLSLKVEDGVYLQLEPSAKKLRTFEAIRDLLVRESENQPLILAVEDLHWIDKISEEFLSYLIDWLANTQILLILLYRPEYTHQWGSKSLYSKIGVDQLSASTSAELVQAILGGGEVVPELRELILGRAGGNPLFVEELTQNLLENGSIQRKDHEYVLSRRASEIEVPETIQGIISARIDRVEESLKRIMQVASVIGREFAFRILQTIMGMREELKSSLLNLQGLEFISEKRLFPELEYIFKHALIQEVAYNSLLRKRRKELHEKIGKTIEGLYPERIEEYYELLAYHYAHSTNNDKAAEYLDCANQRAIKLNAMEDAMAYFDDSMKLLDIMPETDENRRRRISLLIRQWFVFGLLFKGADYHDFLTRYEPEAIKLDNPGILGAFYACIGQCEWTSGSPGKAIRTATKAAELCETAGNAGGAAHAYDVLQWSNVYKGNYEKAIALKEHVLRKIEHQFSLRLSVYTMGATVVAYAVLGRWDEALEEGKEALRVAEEYSDNSLISLAALFISFAYTWKGDLDRAIEYGDLGVQKATTPADNVWSQSILAWVWCRTGELQRGIKTLAATLPFTRAVPYSGIHVMVALGEGYWLAGEYEKARKTLEEALELAKHCEYRYYVGWSQRLLGEVAIETNPVQAVSYFERSIAVLQEIKAENELALAFYGYGRFHKQQGNIKQSREYLRNALEIFERLDTLIQPDRVREELDELPEA